MVKGREEYTIETQTRHTHDKPLIAHSLPRLGLVRCARRASPLGRGFLAPGASRASRAPASACPCMCSLRLARHSMLWRVPLHLSCALSAPRVPLHLRAPACAHCASRATAAVARAPASDCALSATPRVPQHLRGSCLMF